ncbi:HAD-IC family P-type ATPase [Janibacter sp. GXQ6167]|uniref:HAD-IC family P-type ATPase n=1 Tax=Janibacter sp. GXQ6167 TaxID=3240791 RepID=UPI00352317AB
MTNRAAPVTPAGGLTSAEVAERTAAGQTNTQPPPAGRTVSQIVRDNVFTRINAILAVLFGLVLITGQLKQGLFALLIIANSVVGIVQEVRAKRTLDRLSVIGAAHPTVRRDGRSTQIAQDQIVLGDLIEVGSGDQIVVDGEVVEQNHLVLDESLLTGEADPVAKTVGEQVLSGSHVTVGSGVYRATKVGADAYAAQLTAEASRFTLVDSELRRGIDTILKYVTWIIIPVGIMTIWIQLREVRASGRDALLGMVAALVPMIPEGLVLMTSVAFAVGVIRLGKRQCLVQELPAIETLARVDTVCVDKTGTLTEGGMTATEVKSAPGGPDEGAIRDRLAQLLATDPHPNDTNQAIADLVGPPEHRWEVSATAPFSSATKWSGATFAEHGSILLGAPDVLAEAKDPLRLTAQEIGAQGLRVLMVAETDQGVDDPDVLAAIHPIGLVVLRQRLRPDASETIAYFTREGVDVRVISGDNAASVGAVAASVGVAGGPDQAIDARSLPDDPDELAAILDRHAVYGRVTPQQKREMVDALQRSGRIVAMTGDGVNDVLALKDADIGVAMGSGSDASRSAAQIVLLDNRFSSLPAAVAEGRRVIGNIERVATLFLTKTTYSVVLALLVGLFAMPFPFVPIHVTITAWFTIGIPAFILSLAPNQERARSGFTRRVIQRSAPGGVVIGLAAFLTYRLLYRHDASSTPEQISTAVLIVVIVIALWVLLRVTRPDTAWKHALIGASAAAYVVMFTVPPLARFFSLDVKSPIALGVAAGIAGLGIVLCEIIWRRWLPEAFEPLRDPEGVPSA